MALLLDIGECLETGVPLRAYDGGRILPDHAPVDFINQLGDRRNSNDKGKRARGSSAGPGRGSSGWKGPAHRPGPPAPDAPHLGGEDLTEVARQQVGEVQQSYRSARVWTSPDAFWVSAIIEPIDDEPIGAYLATRYPIASTELVQSWAWWTHGIWIGPRHTNYSDGSICSFDLRQRTWDRSRPLRDLWDLHSLWVARHMYLRRYRRWPGPQHVGTPMERYFEQAPDELCGCDSQSSLRYRQCCLSSDAEFVKSLPEFARRRPRRRSPPRAVIAYLFGARHVAPAYSELRN